MGNPIAFDFTYLAQVISFLFIILIVSIPVVLVLFIVYKRKQEAETTKKLDRIIDLLEKIAEKNKQA